MFNWLKRIAGMRKRRREEKYRNNLAKIYQNIWTKTSQEDRDSIIKIGEIANSVRWSRVPDGCYKYKNNKIRGDKDHG